MSLIKTIINRSKKGLKNRFVRSMKVAGALSTRKILLETHNVHNECEKQSPKYLIPSPSTNGTQNGGRS